MSKLPLLKLPLKSFTKVVSLLQLPEQLALVFCSKRTNSIITSVGLKTKRVFIKISKSVNVCLQATEGIFTFEISSATHQANHYSYRPFGGCVHKLNWKMDLERLPRFLRFILRLTHQEQYDELRFENEENQELANLGDISKSIPIKKFQIHDQLSSSYYTAIFTHFDVHTYNFSRNVFGDVGLFQQVITQNFDLLGFTFADPVTLNQMLSMNSCALQFNRNLSPNTFNSFIRLWQKGYSSRIQRLDANFEHDTNFGKYLDGIKVTEICPILHYNCNRPIGKKYPGQMQFVYDLYSLNGRRATIFLNWSSQIIRVRIEFIVWD